METDLITIDALAEKLSVSRSWLYQQVERNRIPHYRLGRSIRFNLESVFEWLAETGENREAEG